MITVNDFSSLTDDLQSVFNERAKRAVSESVGMQLFDVQDTNRRTFDHLVLHGMAGIKKVTPGADLPTITSEEGDTITYTQSYYGGLVKITKEMRMFDLYNQMEGLVASITDDAFNKLDQSMADVLSQGANTSYTDVYGETVSAVTPGGLALFSASHTTPLSSDQFSNIITDGTSSNPALSRDALVKMREVGLTHTDPNGIVRPINYDTLIVSPENEDLAMRLVNSEYLPGSANNDRNPLKGKFKVVVWPRLNTAADGTDTSAYWYLADSNGMKETLKALFAERPSLDAPEQVYESKSWEYSLDYFYVVGRGYPAYIAQSDSTGS